MKKTAALFVVLLIGLYASPLHADDQVRIIKHKTMKKGWFGVAITDVTPKFAREKDLKVKEGAYVNEVVENSPADSAGVKEGDVITEFNSKKIECADDLMDAVGETKPGEKVALLLSRDGEKKNISAVIGKEKSWRPFSMAMSVPRSPRVVIESAGSIEGMELMKLNSQLAEYFGVPGNKGVLVKEVEKKSSAEKAGFKAGDVITKIGKELVTDMDDIHEALEDNDKGDKVDIEVLRKGKSSKLALEITGDDDAQMMWQWDEHSMPNLRFRMDPEQGEEIERNIEMQLQGVPKMERKLERIEKRMKDDEV